MLTDLTVEQLAKLIEWSQYHDVVLTPNRIATWRAANVPAQGDKQ